MATCYCSATTLQAAKDQLQCDSKTDTYVSPDTWETREDQCYVRVFSLPRKRKPFIHLVSPFVTRGMFRSFMSLKINIQRSLAQDGVLGLVSSSRFPSLSMTDTMLARRGVTTPWTRFQRVCLQHGGGAAQFQVRPQWESTRLGQS